MKRSEINQFIEEASQIFAQHGWHLPPFAQFTPEEWTQKGHEYDEVRRSMLGWDITDFGSGDYLDTGLFLFTLRNGDLKDPGNKKPYAEKLMLVKENQKTPFHFHWHKMEDIINRGGGVLMVQVYEATEQEGLSEGPVKVTLDGCLTEVPAGTVLELAPGQSITMHQRLYHQFWGKPGLGPVVVGEVSQVNDDTSDNRFLVERGRFPAIEEDAPALRLLCNEYPQPL